MNSVYSAKNNYDDFNCEQADMILLCQEIDKNYGKNDSKEPTIVHNTLSDSKASCIYSKLNRKKENLWFCLDSKGNSGYTIIDPGVNGYCVDRESAVCPPFIKNIP